MSESDPPHLFDDDEPSRVFRARVTKELVANRDMRTSLNVIKAMLALSLAFGVALGTFVVRTVIEHESRLSAVEHRAGEDRVETRRVLERIEERILRKLEQ